MWKAVLLGAYLSAIGWALSRGQRHVAYPRRLLSGSSQGADTNGGARLPTNVSSIQEHKRQPGDPADTLRSARAAIDRRVRDLLEPKSDAA
jgi:hypothetical protein